MRRKILLISIAISLIFIILYFSKPINEIENSCYDYLSKFKNKKVSDSIVVIGITEEDLTALNQFPLSSDYIFTLLSSLGDTKPKKIIMDFYLKNFDSTNFDFYNLVLKKIKGKVISGAPLSYLKNNKNLLFKNFIEYGYSNLYTSKDGYIRFIPFYSEGYNSVLAKILHKFYKNNLTLYPPYNYLEDYKFFSFIQAINQLKKDSKVFTDKYVFIGYHIVGYSNFFKDPISDYLHSGLNMQVNFLNAILTDKYLININNLYNFFILLILYAIAIFSVLKFDFYKSILLNFLTILGYFLLTILLFYIFSIKIVFVYSIISNSILFSIIMFIKRFEYEKSLRIKISNDEKIIRLILDNFNGKAILVDNNFNIIFCNNYEIEDNFYEYLKNLFFSFKKENIMSKWDEYRENGRIFKITIEKINSSQKINPSDSQKELFLIIFYDITENIQLQEKLKEKVHLANIGQMAATIAHEIRNPLAGLELAAMTIKNKLKNNDSIKAYTDNMILAIKNLNKLVTEFLDYSKEIKLEKREFLFDKLINEALFGYGNIEKPIEFKKEFEKNIKIYGDPDRLRQIFINFIKNSIDAIKEKGTIIFRVEKDEENYIIKIIDDGIGIKKEELEFVFNPFFTTKPDGSGLGLALSKRIIEAHGGKIKIFSQYKKGTTIMILLPLKGEEKIG